MKKKKTRKNKASVVAGGSKGSGAPSGSGAAGGIAGALAAAQHEMQEAMAAIESSRLEVERARRTFDSAGQEATGAQQVVTSARVRLDGASGAPAPPEQQPVPSAGAAPQYGDQDYWEQRYEAEAETGSMFEWYVEYGAFKHLLRRWLPPSSARALLVIGCGNSTLSEDMHADGYHRVVSIDNSSSVIDDMCHRHGRVADINPQHGAATEGGTVYSVMDATALAFDGETFDGVVDKGTLDAVLAGCDQAAVDSANKIGREAMRVLRPGTGCYVIVSSIPPLRYSPVLSEWCGAENLSVETLTTGYGEGEHGEDLYVYCLRKHTREAAAMAEATRLAAQTVLGRAPAGTAEQLQIFAQLLAMRRQQQQLASSTSSAQKLLSRAKDDLETARSEAGAALSRKAASGVVADGALPGLKQAALEAAKALSAEQAQASAASDAREERVADQRHFMKALAGYAEQKGVESGECIVQRAAGGGSAEYSWSQTNDEVTIEVIVRGLHAREQVSCDINADTMSLALAGAEPLLEGRFPHSVKPTECCWWLSRARGDSTSLHVQLAKFRAGRAWAHVLLGEPVLDMGASVRDFTAVAKNIRSELGEDADSAADDGAQQGEVAGACVGSSRGTCQLSVRGYLPGVAQQQRVCVCVQLEGHSSASCVSDGDWVGVWRADEAHDLGKFLDSCWVEEEHLGAPTGEVSLLVKTASAPAQVFQYVSAGGAVLGKLELADIVVAGISEPSAMSKATTPDFVLEQHKNINCYQLLVKLPMTAGSATVEAPTTKLSPRQLILQYTCGEQKYCLDLTFERAVESSKCAMTIQTDHISVRLPLAPRTAAELADGCADIDSDSLPIPTRAELEPSNLSTLSCRFCEAELTRTGALKSAKPLPSEHWAELAEFWVCHECNLGSNPLWSGSLVLKPRQSRCLVGSSYLLLHVDDVDGLIVTGEDGGVQLARCERCETVVGTYEGAVTTTAPCSSHAHSHSSHHDAHDCGQGEQPSSPPSAEAAAQQRENWYCLHKHDICAVSAEGAKDVLACYSASTIVACAMRHAAEARGCFKFSVALGEEEEVAGLVRVGAQPDPAGRTSHVNLQIMSWHSRVRSKVDGAELPACRVCFEVCEQKTAAATAAGATAATSKSAVEWLVLTEDGCEQLIQGLVESSQVLPASARTMLGKTVGFLYFPV